MTSGDVDGEVRLRLRGETGCETGNYPEDAKYNCLTASFLQEQRIALPFTSNCQQLASSTYVHGQEAKHSRTWRSSLPTGR